MKIKFVDLQRQYHRHQQELDSAISKILESGDFIGGLKNPEVNNFENSFASFLGVKHCIACGNGTDALEISLRAMGIGPGDEVIVPALTWISTAECVCANGATPVFADIDPETYTISPAEIERKITPRTKAVIPVHLYGLPAGMPEICALAEKHNILILEDCAQSHGAACHGRMTGSFGAMAEFSFYPGKNLGAYGDAGGIVTNDDDLAARARMIAQHGQSGRKFHHQLSGRNSRMDGLQAAILNVKLPYLREWTQARRRIAAKFQEGLKGSRFVLPKTPDRYEPVWHLFAILSESRDADRAALAEAGIPTGIQYPVPLPLLDAYAYLGGKPEEYPAAVKVSRQVLTLPLFPEMADEEAEYVIEKVRSL